MERSREQRFLSKQNARSTCGQENNVNSARARIAARTKSSDPRLTVSGGNAAAVGEGSEADQMEA